jgi:hypothetical protein
MVNLLPENCEAGLQLAQPGAGKDLLVEKTTEIIVTKQKSK